MATGNPDTQLKFCQKSGPFTKPCTNVTRLHILMRFSTVLMIRHFLVTFLRTDDDETLPTIQDGGRQTGSSVHCILLQFAYLLTLLAMWPIVTDTNTGVVYE